MAVPSSAGPLDGLLVADFSRILAGPYATMLLGDLGATIVKVESPAGDDTRTWMPPTTPEGISTYYLSVNRNKRSIALDLTDQGDLALARSLAARADVLVENHKPGGMARFGLAYDDVRAANPAVVYASITAFGTGEGASLPGYDLVVQAASGLMSLQGEADGPPLRAGVAVIDVIAGLHAAVGILAALRRRDATGRGEMVEVDLLSSALSGLVNQASAVVAGGVVPHRMGNSHPSLYPYCPMATADGEVVVIAGNDGQFEALCALLEVPELASDPRFATNADRTANRGALEPLLLERLSTRTTAEWVGAMRAAGLPGGPVNDVAEGIAFAEQLGLAPVVSVDGVASIRNPIGMREAPATYRLPPPAVDQDGVLLREWLSQGGGAKGPDGQGAG